MRSTILLLTISLSTITSAINFNPAIIKNIIETGKLPTKGDPVEPNSGVKPTKVRRTDSECLNEWEGPCFRQADCCGYKDVEGLGCFNLPGEEHGACLKEENHVPNLK